jgi:hypothetical protein
VARVVNEEREREKVVVFELLVQGVRFGSYHCFSLFVSFFMAMIEDQIK